MVRVLLVLACAGAGLGAGCGTFSSEREATADRRMSDLLHESETFGQVPSGGRPAAAKRSGVELSYERLMGSIGP
jgi:hypothetical protein